MIASILFLTLLAGPAFGGEPAPWEDEDLPPPRIAGKVLIHNERMTCTTTPLASKGRVLLSCSPDGLKVSNCLVEPAFDADGEYSGLRYLTHCGGAQ